jgi:glucose/arabinose dehydrogenase
VQAAHAFGVSHSRILGRHVLPNVVHIILITFVLDFSSLVLAEAVLSYIGVGIDPSMGSWGNMINGARSELSREPAVWWTPVISPGDLIVYRGDLFPDWRGDALAAGLSSQAIVRIELDGDTAREVERYPMGARIRSVAEGPDGALWVLEDERGESRGRLLKLTPRD